MSIRPPTLPWLALAILLGLLASCGDGKAPRTSATPARDPVSPEDVARWRDDKHYKQYVDLTPEDVEAYMRHYPPYVRFVTDPTPWLDSSGRVDPEKVRRAVEKEPDETPIATRELALIGRGPRHDAYFEALGMSHVDYARIHHNLLANWFAMHRQEELDALEDTDRERLLYEYRDRATRADTEEEAESLERMVSVVESRDARKLVVEGIPVSEGNLAIVRRYRLQLDRLFGSVRRDGSARVDQRSPARKPSTPTR